MNSDVLETVALPDGVTVAVRRAAPADVDGVDALYRRLGPEDLRRRFFLGHAPPRSFVESWVTAERGGAAIVVEAIDADGARIIGEAAYSVLANGDGELGITVDPEWRGWLGPWLLDHLVEVARGAGIGNIEADLLAANRPMRRLIEHRGHAVVERPDWRLVRLSFSTDGDTPGWPPRPTGPRLLVEAPAGRWSGEAAARAAGFDVRLCPGPEGRAAGCPVTAGRGCPLADGADAIVVALDGREDGTAVLVADHRRRRPDRPVVQPAPTSETCTGEPWPNHRDLVDELRDSVERAPRRSVDSDQGAN